MQIEFEGSSFSFKKIITALFKYKWINLFILMLTLLFGLTYYYLKHPTYESTATLEILTNPLENRKDFFGNIIGRAHGIETEIDILKSEFLLNKTLHSIDRNVAYYKKYMFKDTLLYDKKPFELKEISIDNKSVFNKVFNVRHIDKNRFELSYKRSLLSQLLELLPSSIRPVNLDIPKKRIYRYGEVVKLPHCSFVVKKTGLYQRAEYSFEFNKYEDIINSIKKSISIKPASYKSSVLRITYKDKIAKRAQDFLNAYIENYLSYSKRNMVETDDKTLEFINKQLNLISGKLENSENSLQGYKRANNISDLETQKKQAVDKLSSFQEQLKNAEVELNVIKNIYKKVMAGQYNSISSLAKNYPVLNIMLENLEDQKLEKEKKLSIFTKFHPDVISLTKGINNMQKNIVEISKSILDRSYERVSSLRKVVREYTYKLQALPKLEQELVKHKRLFTVNDKVYNYLLQKQSELSIEKASTILNKKILDYAKQPDRPLSPRLGSVLATSLFLGFVFALLHTLLRVKFDTKIKDRYDVHTLTDIPLFGLIPFVKNREKYNSAYVLDEPNSKASEAFRMIKNNLEYSATDKNSKVILITSSVPNEGKTTVSANLSAVLGMGEKKCIILSLDLRRPDLHHRFGLSNKIGMSDVLSNKVDIKDATWENEQYKNFNIVTSGNIPPNPAELLASKRMKELIEELKKSYDYIVLDTPPFEYVSDALSLMKYADITLFVVKSEFSESRYIKEINKLVKKVGIENAGIILNSVKSKYNVTKKFDYRYIYHEA
jgi:capsular exopolysaccharide synthesis family protein